MTNNVFDQEINHWINRGLEYARAAAAELKNLARSSAETLRSRAQASTFRGRPEEVVNEAKAQARRFRRDGEQYVRDNPLHTVLIVLGIGVLVGTIFRRR